MSRTDSEKTAAGSGHRSGFLAAIAHHLLHNWAGILLVSSVISLAKHHSTWLAAFDGYTFLIVSNTASSIQRFFTQHPEATVVLIDPQTFELRYRERTPLNRCELTRDLRAIYSEKPDIVAIDIDLSPALWLQPKAAAGKPAAMTNDCPTTIANDEASCQQQLYSLIRCAAAADIRTILVEPAPAAPELPDHQRIKDDWKTDIGRDQPNHVVFAQTNLREQLGMLLTYQTAPDSMPIVARRLACKSDPDSRCSRRIEKVDESNTAYVDARTFRYELEFMPLARYADANEFSEELQRNLTAIRDRHGPGSGVVFYGGAYGESDVFTSSMGLMYGVETLAGIYVSDNIATTPWLDFMFDFLVGALFGMYIASRWRLFFVRRSHPDPLVRQHASISLVKLVASLTGMLLVAICFAVLLISTGGIWFSPVPMFIGMLFDSFITGSVEQGLHKYREGVFMPPPRSKLHIFLRPVFFGAWRLWKRGDRKAATFVWGWNVFATIIIVMAHI